MLTRGFTPFTFSKWCCTGKSGQLASNWSVPQGKTEGEQVKGARKIWGTLRTTTTTAIERALSTLTKVSSKDVVVKRKYKTAQRDPHQVTKWWFVLRGEEEVLQQLQEEWPSVALQTTWKLQPVLYVPTSTQELSDSVSSPGVDVNKAMATEGLNSEERHGVHPIPPQPVSQHAPVTPVLGHPLVMCPQGVSPLRQMD